MHYEQMLERRSEDRMARFEDTLRSICDTVSRIDERTKNIPAIDEKTDKRLSRLEAARNFAKGATAAAGFFGGLVGAGFMALIHYLLRGK